MPPVRDPSTKPSAATVLPAPVACSNQNRRAAPGSSRWAAGASSSSAPSPSSPSAGPPALVPVERLLLLGRQLVVALDLDLCRGQLLDDRGLAVSIAIAVARGR